MRHFTCLTACVIAIAGCSEVIVADDAGEQADETGEPAGDCDEISQYFADPVGAWVDEESEMHLTGYASAILPGGDIAWGDESRLVRISVDGELRWEHGAGADSYKLVGVSADGELYVAGTTVGSVLLLARFDADGNQLQRRTFDISEYVEVASMQRVVPSGEQIVDVHTLQVGEAALSHQLIRFDRDLNQVWAEAPRHSDDVDIEVGSDGTIYVLNTVFVQMDLWQVELSARTADNELLWSREFEIVSSGTPGNELAVGDAVYFNASARGSGESYLAALDLHGDLLWQTTIEGDSIEAIAAAQCGLYLGGRTAAPMSAAESITHVASLWSVNVSGEFGPITQLLEPPDEEYYFYDVTDILVSPLGDVVAIGRAESYWGFSPSHPRFAWTRSY